MCAEKTKTIAEQIQALKIGKGIQYLVNEACKLLGNPVLVHDMDYKLIACTENIVTDDPIWNEFVTTGTVNIKRIEFYKNESFLDIVASVPKITYLRSDELKYDRIFAKLFNRDNIQIGCAVVKEAFRSFNDDDLALFELFCDILNKEIAKSAYYKDYGQAYQEGLINKLLAGDFEDRAIYTAHIESIYINLKTHLRLAVADIGPCDAPDARLPFYRDLFKRTRADFKYAIVNHYILILMSFDQPSLPINDALKKLHKIFIKESICVGVSSSFENLFALERYYTEALAALRFGLKADTAERVFLYDDIKDDSP